MDKICVGGWIEEKLHKWIENKYPKRIVNLGSRWWKNHKKPPRYPAYYDKKCVHLHALYSTLLQLKPKYCLEIGTHTGLNSTKVFEKYFNDHQPDGCLITLDLIPCQNLDPENKNIHQVIVAPHHENIVEMCGAQSPLWPGFAKKDLSLFDKFEYSVAENIEIVSAKMASLGIEKFDLAFIDGDHEEQSFKNDIDFCKMLTRPPCYMILDDTKEEFHACCHVYHDEIKNSNLYDCYDFENWENFVGMSIIRRKK